jgi:ribosomal protein S18 acetylase RimI-like enzyme
MKTEFRRAEKPRELRSLEIFDRKAFHQYPADWFDREDWKAFDAWWLIVDNRKIGCCAFERASDSCLYIASTGILPAFQGQGFGDLFKCWQISYARHHGFQRMITNSRKSNTAMIRLNRKFGFKVLRTTAGYYESPREATVVMELKL